MALGSPEAAIVNFILPLDEDLHEFLCFRLFGFLRSLVEDKEGKRAPLSAKSIAGVRC